MQTDDVIILLIDELSRTHGRLVPVKASFIEKGDPTGLANVLLTAVVRAERPPTVPQIGRSLGYQRQTIQRQADALVETGLIAWIENPDHKSSRRLVPTDEGRAVHTKASDKSRRWATRFAEGLDVVRLEEALSTLRAFRSKLEADARRTGA